MLCVRVVLEWGKGTGARAPAPVSGQQWESWIAEAQGGTAQAGFGCRRRCPRGRDAVPAPERELWRPARPGCELLLPPRAAPVLISSWNGLIGVSTPGIKASNTEIHTIHPVSAQCRETGNNWCWMRSERCCNNTRWCLGWQKLIRTCLKKAMINGSEQGNAVPPLTPLWWGLKSKRLFSFSRTSRGHPEYITAIFSLCFLFHKYCDKHRLDRFFHVSLKGYFVCLLFVLNEEIGFLLFTCEIVIFSGIICTIKNFKTSPLC